MSTYRADVFRIGPMTRHPNADKLSIIKPFGYECLVRTDDFKEGDLAIYFPVDTITNEEPEFAFMGAGKRIKAVRLRGIYSEGLVVKARPGMREGDDAAEVLGVKKYQEPDDEAVAQLPTKKELRVPGIKGWFRRVYFNWRYGHKPLRRPDYFPKFGDPRHLKRYPDEIGPDEYVVVTSKIHGANMGVMWSTEAPPGKLAAIRHAILRFFGCRPGRLLLTSKEMMKDWRGDHWWGKAVRQNGLLAKCQKAPNVAIYGELYGAKVQKGFAYDAGPGEFNFRAFAAFDARSLRWLRPPEFINLADRVGIPTVPMLLNGMMRDIDPRAIAEEDEVEGLRQGTPGAMREGVVISRWFYGAIPGSMLKLISQRYLLRKDATEYK